MNPLRTYFKSLLVYGLLVSGLSALAEWSSFALFLFRLDIHYVPSSVLAFFVGTTINSVLSRKLAFTSKGRKGTHEIALIYATSAIAFLFNLATLTVLVELLDTPPMLGKIAGTVVAFFFNYALRQFFIFSSKPRW